MQTIPLSPLPVQTLTIPLDGNEWEIEIRTTSGTISVSLTLNGALVIRNTRAVAGKRIIPYKYLETGNFAILTQNFEVPDYTKFGSTQTLVYISAAELEALRATKPLLYTAADFDPNGALPLRFKPQGYLLTPAPLGRITAVGDRRRTAAGDLRITGAL